MLRQARSLALAGIVLLTGCQRNEDRTLADELDRIIEQRQTFNDKKEERIGELKRMLDVTGLSPRQEYDINARLCDQYLIPMATNAATAEVLIQGLRRGDFDWRDIVNPKRD